MFVSFFTICILLSIFALCLAFLHFVKKKLHCFQSIRIENFFMCIIRTERTFMYQKTIKVSGLFILVMGLGCAYNWGTYN